MKDKRQELRNNFDDAYLALLMDELSEEEGALLLEESNRLNADPDAAVPESLHMKCMEVVESHYAQKRRLQRVSKGKVVIRKVLVVAAVIVVLFTTAFATIEEFRVGVLNFVLDVQEKYSTLVFEEESSKNAQGEKQEDIISETARWFCDGRIAVDYNLAGFEVLENISDEYGTVVYLVAEDLGQSILIQSTKIVDGIVSQIDTEDADLILDVSIGDYSGCMVIKDARNHIVWVDSQNNMMLEIITNGVAKENSIALAENVLYVSK